MNSFGLEPRHVEVIEKLVWTPLKAIGCRVWVFGSRARGDHRKFSDLDLLIEGQPPPKLLGEIREKLEESLLPIKVDLVLEDELAESYRANVLRDRVLLGPVS